MGFPHSLEPENTSSAHFLAKAIIAAVARPRTAGIIAVALPSSSVWHGRRPTTSRRRWLAVNAQQAPTKKRSCCEHEHGCNDSDDESTQDVISLRAPRCHGIAMLWLSHGPMAPETIEIRWTFDWVLVGFVDSPYVMTSDVCQLPAVPPPRHVSDAA